MYYCSICSRQHYANSEIGKEHFGKIKPLSEAKTVSFEKKNYSFEPTTRYTKMGRKGLESDDPIYKNTNNIIFDINHYRNRIKRTEAHLKEVDVPYGDREKMSELMFSIAHMKNILETNEKELAKREV